VVLCWQFGGDKVDDADMGPRQLRGYHAPPVRGVSGQRGRKRPTAGALEDTKRQCAETGIRLFRWNDDVHVAEGLFASGKRQEEQDQDEIAGTEEANFVSTTGGLLSLLILNARCGI